MPVTTITGIDRMKTMGAAVPQRSSSAWSRLTNEAARVKFATRIRAATALCQELLDANAPGLHFYTLNRSTATSEIYHALFG